MPRTLYFYSESENEWTALAGWWNDSAYTSQAVALPTSLDDVLIYSSVADYAGYTSRSWSVKSLTAKSGAYVSYIQISVSQPAIFESGSYLYDYGTIIGDAMFYGTAGSYGTVTGSASFNN